jgi:3-hydroxyisobutyrate dehydrogenase
MRYGFIGLGNLGGHLAASLLKADFDVSITDIDPALGRRHLDMNKGCAWCETPEEIARDCDAVITCLPSPEVSEKVLNQVLDDGEIRRHMD